MIELQCTEHTCYVTKLRGKKNYDTSMNKYAHNLQEMNIKIEL